MTPSQFAAIPIFMGKKVTPSVFAWALYDWGNSAFATTVMAAFFPIFFKKYWSQGMDPSLSTFYLGTAMSTAALLFAAAAPILGIFADFYGWKRKGLLLFATLGAVMTGALFLVDSGHWILALTVYCIAWVGYTGGNLFYDSLLVDVAPREQISFVSGLGYGLGYLGGGLLIIVHAAMVTSPEIFGLESPVQGVKWAFLTVGIWWLIFTMPLTAIVKEPSAKLPRPHWRQGFTELRKTLSEVFANKNLLTFLIAFFFYIDGVHTIYKMAVDFAMAIQLEPSELIKAIIIVQFVGFPSTIILSLVAQKVGSKKTIYFGLGVYILVCCVGSLIQTATHFYILAITIGLVQGGVQALSRSIYGQLIPQKKSAEYFGFYSMFGKFSAILGPVLVGMTSLATGSPRMSLFIIVFLFLIGGFLLRKVKVPG